MRYPMDLWRRDAWPVSTLQKEMERVFDTFGGGWNREFPMTKTFNPACNVEETTNAFLFTFDVPGVPKENIKIEMNGNLLTVSGERKEEKKDDKKNHHVYERYEGSFSRSFTLPTNIATERVDADFHNGVLKITVPKTEANQTKQIKIGDKKAF